VIQNTDQLLVGAHKFSENWIFIFLNRLLVNELGMLHDVLLICCYICAFQEIGGISYISFLVEGILLSFNIGYLEINALTLIDIHSVCFVVHQSVIITLHKR
jgi:hypothetical protein